MTPLWYWDIRSNDFLTFNTKSFHYLKTASQVFNVKLLIGYYFGLCIFDSIFCVSWQPVAQERGCILFDKHLMYLFLSLKINCSAFIVSFRKLCAFLVSMFKSLEKKPEHCINELVLQNRHSLQLACSYYCLNNYQVSAESCSTLNRKCHLVLITGCTHWEHPEPYFTIKCN